MTTDERERWDQIRQIWHEVIDSAPEDRADRVHALCRGDRDLEAEVLRLLKADADAGSFLEDPPVPDALLAEPPKPLAEPGELLAERYRVVAEIGQGGMGEVYEARDEVIGEVIAVKLVRPNREPVHAAASRWRREVLLARKISHPGICRVHDVAIHRWNGGEQLFLTMERVRGDSLQRRMDHGQTTLAEALDLSRQIGAALDAAHQQGVLHRDIKPANVIVEARDDGSLRAVITDFGLARDRKLDPADVVTETGCVAGTLGYMAPELVQGGAPSVASDLYAFALLVKGLAASGLSQPDTRVSAIFVRALSPEPAARFNSAGAFVDALSAAVTRRRSRRRPVALALVIVAVGVALIVAGFRLYDQGASAIAPSSQVLLLDMVNGTGEPEFDGAREILRSQLAQSPHFELLDDGRAREVLTQMGQSSGTMATPEIAREVAMREGVPLVAYSALTRLGEERVLTIKLEQTGARPSVPGRSWTQTFWAATKAAVPDTMHAAALWIRRMAGELPASVEKQDRMPAETTTSSWEALALFKQANDFTATGRVQDATLLLEEAVRRDPEFAMGYARLGDNLMSLKRDAEGYAAWERAIALAERRQLTSRETLRIRGQYFDDTGNLVEAEKAYRTYEIHYPNDFYAAFFLGSALLELDRSQEAVTWLERAHELRPGSLIGSVHLAKTYVDLGRRDDANRVIDALQAEGQIDWWRWLRALIRFLDGDIDGALQGLEPLRGSADLQWRSRASTIRASWLSEQGDDRSALAELRSGVDFDSSHGFRDRLADKWLQVAELQRRLGERAYTASAGQAVDIAPTGGRLATAAAILVEGGDLSEARRFTARFAGLPSVPATIAARRRVEGLLLVAGGQAGPGLQALVDGYASVKRNETKFPLARALARTGDVLRAERVLESIVNHPALVYSGPEPAGPGLLRQAVLELIRVTASHDDAAADVLRQRYARFLRPGLASDR